MFPNGAPVVEEDIRDPEMPGVEDDRVHSSILRTVPLQLVVSPALGEELKMQG